MNKPVFDGNENPERRRPQKLKECETQIAKNDYAIMQLEKENLNFILDKYHDPKTPEIQQKIKDNEKKIRELQKNTDVRKRCQELNSGGVLKSQQVACAKCERIPNRVEDVHRAVPQEPGYCLHITG
jgi:hypothetical protein